MVEDVEVGLVFLTHASSYIDLPFLKKTSYPPFFFLCLFFLLMVCEGFGGDRDGSGAPNKTSGLVQDFAGSEMSVD